VGTRSKIITLVILIPLVIILWPSAAGGKTDFMIVQGNSMLPTILPGSFVITQQEDEYEVGDVVAYNLVQDRIQQIVVHRIIEYDKLRDIIALQGDNNPRVDPGTYSKNNIIGEVKVIIPFVGDALTFMRNPVILVLLIGISAVWQMQQAKKKKRKEDLQKRRLGLSKHPPKTETLTPKVAKKQDYSLFFAAMALNIVMFLGTQISISSGIKPKGDSLTGFLFNFLEPSTASTLTFFIYFMGIIGLYFIAKRYDMKNTISQQRLLKRGIFLKQKSSKMVLTAQIFWTLFLLVGILYLITIWGDFLPIPI
jgi:signal peptidase I